jgi:hypothetical protein
MKRKLFFYWPVLKESWIPKYVQQLNVLDDLDSDIEFSEMGSSDEEEIDSDDDTVLDMCSKIDVI